MRLSRLFVMSVVVVASLAACGGGDGDGSVDAPKQVDAAIDAPASLMGLGQKCVVAMAGADCPANANGCLSYAMGATMGVCTKICVANGTFMTNAMSVPGNFAPDPSTKDVDCAAIYTGGALGTPSCSALTARTPGGALTANTNYTFMMACEISCGTGNTCPAGLTCNTMAMSCAP